MFSFKTASRIGVALSVMGMMAAAVPASAQDHAADVAALGGDAANGEKLFKRKCASCHFADEEKKKTGPGLLHVFGRHAGGADGFKYSKAMTEAGEGGLVWTVETMSQYLDNPKKFIKGNRMSFAGFKKPEEIADVLTYLHEAAGESPTQ